MALPSMVLDPGLFSTIIWASSVWATLCAIIRAATSVVDPAASGTTNWIARAGNFCACATPAARKTASPRTPEIRGRTRSPLRHQAGKQLRIDIPAREHRHSELLAHIYSAGEQRRERDRAARLDHELQFTKREGDGAADLLVARRDAGADQFAVDLEGDTAGRLRHQGIADRAADRSVALAPPARERARMIVESGRLRREHLRGGQARLDGERDPGGENAARRVHDHQVGRKPEGRQILDDLAAGRALPGDDPRIVIGRHQHRVALLRDVARDRLPVVAPP